MVMVSSGGSPVSYNKSTGAVPASSPKPITLTTRPNGQQFIQTVGPGGQVTYSPIRGPNPVGRVVAASAVRQVGLSFCNTYV